MSFVIPAEIDPFFDLKKWLKHLQSLAPIPRNGTMTFVSRRNHWAQRCSRRLWSMRVHTRVIC